MFKMYLQLILIRCVLLVCASSTRNGFKMTGGYDFGEYYVMKPGEKFSASTIVLKHVGLGEPKCFVRTDDFSFIAQSKIKDLSSYDFELETEVNQFPNARATITCAWFRNGVNVHKIRQMNILVDLNLNENAEILVHPKDIAKENGTYFVVENERLTVYCIGGGPGNIMLQWVDGTGFPMIPNERIEISNAKVNIYAITYYRILHLNVTADMKAVGCRQTNNQSITTEGWFHFTVVYPPVPTLFLQTIPTSNNTCEPITYKFFCSVKAVHPEKVQYEWILNHKVSIFGTETLTINSSEVNVKDVVCSVRDQYGVSTSREVLPVMDTSDCSGLAEEKLSWIIIFGITLSVIVILTSIYAITKVYCCKNHKDDESFLIPYLSANKDGVNFSNWQDNDLP